MKSSRYLAVASAALLTLLLSACERPPEVHHTTFLAFGTLTELTVAGIDQDKTNAVVRSLEADFREMEHAWHAWRPGPTTRTNWLLGEKRRFAAPPSVVPLVKISRELSIKSDDLFNPAIGGLIKLWGFQSDDSTRSRPPPDPAAIAALVKAKPRMEDITIDGFMLSCTNPAVQLDFGAIGKGYGIDFAIEHLRELGVNNAIVNAGGDLRAIGSKGGQPWRIAIRGADGKGVLGEIDVDGDESVFTSGNYERTFEWQGKHYHHILDPRTGYPARGTRSVTVLHDNATVADAAATALFVAGPKDWARIAAQMGVRKVLLVDEDNVIHITPAMAKRVKLSDPSMPKVVTELPKLP
jgi:thiamine biosynthesis lipoprotein